MSGREVSKKCKQNLYCKIVVYEVNKYNKL